VNITYYNLDFFRSVASPGRSVLLRNVAECYGKIRAMHKRTTISQVNARRVKTLDELEPARSLTY